MPLELAPGLLRVERIGDDEPQRCSEIGCPCVIPKQLQDRRTGPDSLMYFCPSSRIAATVSRRTGGFLILGAHYWGPIHGR